MAETLHIENFGPIKKASINIKRNMIFIGPQASGKSTIAKLIAILRNSELIIKPKEVLEFKKYCKNFNIDGYFSEK